MNIDLLYFDGCPTHVTAADLIREVADELGVSVVVQPINVETDEQARDLGFLGSPSIRVDGVDIDPGARTRTDFGRRCRLYPSSEGFAGAPPRDWLVAALRGEQPAAAGLPAGTTPTPACCASARKLVSLLVADWCPQCPSAKQYWQQLAPELDFELELVDIGTEVGRDLASKHGVRAVPSVVIDGRVLGAGVARPPYEDVVAALGLEAR